MSPHDLHPDLTSLPTAVRATAHVLSNGEVAWPKEHAREAIEALAGSGRLILGLDARTLCPDGGVSEVAVSAWSARPGEQGAEQIERARTEALAALPRAIELGVHILITWS